MAKRKRSRTTRYQVFLSYSHHDRWIAEVMKEKIEEQGVAVWLDVFDLPGGADIADRIREAMQASQECLVLLTPAAKKSEWVPHEVGMADGMKLWTTLILLHVGTKGVPEPVRTKSVLSINDFDAYLAHLQDRKRAAEQGA